MNKLKAKQKQEAEAKPKGKSKAKGMYVKNCVVSKISYLTGFHMSSIVFA